MIPKPRGGTTPSRARRKPKYNVQIGDRFEYLVVISDVFTNGSERRVMVECDCGNRKPYNVPALFRRTGKKCCGCRLGYSTLLTHNGVTQSLSKWAASLEISLPALRGRLARGWTIEQALTLGRTKPCTVKNRKVDTSEALQDVP